MLLAEPGAARGRQHGRNRGHHPGKDKDNRKGQRKGNGPGKGAGKPLDCPDTTISCRTFFSEICGDVVGSFFPVGRCGAGLCCGLCDTAHWDTYCNTTFPTQCQGNCIANDEEILGCGRCGNIL
jgi:hypothetical protein